MLDNDVHAVVTCRRAEAEANGTARRGRRPPPPVEATPDERENALIILPVAMPASAGSRPCSNANTTAPADWDVRRSAVGRR